MPGSPATGFACSAPPTACEKSAKRRKSMALRIIIAASQEISMKRSLFRLILSAVVLTGVSIATRVTGQGSGQPSTAKGEWPMYTADLRGSKYSPLDQLNAGNFNQLEVAWRSEEHTSELQSRFGISY